MGLPALPTLPANLPLDWMLVAALVVIFALDTFRSGAARASALSFALPAAYALYLFIGKAAFISDSLAKLTAPATQAALFLAILVPVTLLVLRIGFSAGIEAGAPIQALLAGAAVAAIFVSFWLQVPALDTIWHFGSQAQSIFAVPYRFWWLAASYVALAAVRS